MVSSRRHRNKEATVVCNSKSTLHNCCRVTSTSGIASSVENPSIAFQPLLVTAQKMATPIQKADGEYTFAGLAGGPCRKKPVLMILATQNYSSAQLEQIVRKQITSIRVLVKDAVV